MPISADKKKLYTEVVAGERNGIALHEVMECLGETIQETGYLCSSSKINKWAKYRPVDLAVKAGQGDHGQLTEAQRHVAKWGWQIVSANSPAPLVDHYLGDQSEERLNGWKAQGPKGGIEVSPFRLLDFDGYAHLAVPPIVKCSVGTSARTNVSGSGITLSVIPSFVDDNMPGLTLQDIADALQGLNGLYLGFVMFRGEIDSSAQAGNSAYAIVTAAQPISVTEDGYSGLSATITTYNTSAHPWSAWFGQYTCIPFLCTTRIAQKESWTSGSPAMGTLYTCPLLSAWNCQVRNSGSGGGGGTVQQYFRGTKMGNGSVKWELSLANTGNASITRAVGVWLCKTELGSPASRSLVAGERHLDFGNVTIARNGTYTDTGIIGNIPEDVYASCVLWLQIGTEYYRYFIMQLPEE